VDTRHEHVLVVRAVEDADHPARRYLLVHAPEEVVLLLQLGGCSEARYGAALRVDDAEHLTNGAVLAGGIASLEHDQQCVAGFGIEDALELGDLSGVLLRLGLTCALVHAGIDPGVLVGEPDVRLPFDRLELHALPR
jgi:hypothetical protein